MKLLSAHFQNFRLLQDLELHFSTDPVRHLTVVRAANETGKTTLLMALQWALYGDQALPDKGEGYRLHPIDWDSSKGRTVPIVVTVEFEVVKYNRIAGTVQDSRHRYRLIRSTSEDLTGVAWRRAPSNVKLFALKERGATLIDSPESVIDDELPLDLREVFFTDGDRALSFIESGVAVSTKRERVENAIRSLLGLGVIEKAINHVGKAAGEINRHVRRLGGNTDLDALMSRLDAQTDALTKHEEKLVDAKQQFRAFDEKLNEIDRKISDALAKGDREQLDRDLVAAKKAIARCDDRIDLAEKDHSLLFRSSILARDILAPVLGSAFDQLRTLHDKGKIPNTTIPVLEERLATAMCICGESLVDDAGDGTRRRDHISQLIEQSRSSDAVQEVVTELYYGSKALAFRADDDAGWIEAYREVAKNRDGLRELREEEGRKFRALELKLDTLADTDVRALREVQLEYRRQRDRFNAQIATVETQIEGVRQLQRDLEQQRDKSLRERKKGARILSEVDVVSDAKRILESAFHRITGEELAKVSALMNAIFLEMIGADPDQGAIIRKAVISEEFDIIVFGPNERTLNPDRDLNGASRRALTLAFILALTKVSEVEAPNVIDTPLGMMSGFVKRSVLRAAIRESSQLVLFLTHSEIAGCEEILDNNAGAVSTLTNPAHYPVMLVNDPHVSERKVISCKCNHRESCDLCARREDVDRVLATSH